MRIAKWIEDDAHYHFIPLSIFIPLSNSKILNNLRPYSLYAYGMVDGRIKFALVPRRSALLVNIKQMTIYYNPKVRCTLVLLSFETNCLVAFDARYFQNENGKMKNENFESTLRDLLGKGQPVVFEINRGTVTASPLDPEEFHAKY